MTLPPSATNAATLAHDVEDQMNRKDFWQELRQDAAYGARTLRRAPLYTIIAVLTLAIGIGASTAIFSVVHAVLLRALPYRDADRVVAIWNGYREGGAISHTAIAPAGVCGRDGAEPHLRPGRGHLPLDGEPHRRIAGPASGV